MAVVRGLALKINAGRSRCWVKNSPGKRTAS
jgi:hypothetical protein